MKSFKLRRFAILLAAVGLALMASAAHAEAQRQNAFGGFSEEGFKELFLDNLELPLGTVRDFLARYSESKTRVSMSLSGGAVVTYDGNLTATECRVVVGLVIMAEAMGEKKLKNARDVTVLCRGHDGNLDSVTIEDVAIGLHVTQIGAEGHIFSKTILPPHLDDDTRKGEASDESG